MQLQPFGRSDLDHSIPSHPKIPLKGWTLILFQHSFRSWNQAGKTDYRGEKSANPLKFDLLQSFSPIGAGKVDDIRIDNPVFLYTMAAVPCRLGSGVRPVGTRKWSQRKWRHLWILSVVEIATIPITKRMDQTIHSDTSVFTILWLWFNLLHLCIVRIMWILRRPWRSNWPRFLSFPQSQRHGHGQTRKTLLFRGLQDLQRGFFWNYTT